MAEENININGTEDNGTENTTPEVVFRDEQKALIAQMI